MSGRYVAASWGASLRAAMEYRGAFLMQALFMVANNFIFLAFWGVFFRRFQTVRGWRIEDMALLYGVSASGFGLAVVLMGGCLDIARRISSGGLDTWLLRSRSVFVQAGTSQMRLSGFGDLASGVILFAASGPLRPSRIALYAAMTIVSATVMVAFVTICHSASFYIGRAEDLANQGMYALITFALYPSGLFVGPSRFVLYVLIPAGLMSYTPANLLRHFSWSEAALLGAGVAALATAAALAWTIGLRRYESGNLTQNVTG
ncbi:MAG: ABC-2 family transporter protein [Acidobacteriota bacterium]